MGALAAEEGRERTFLGVGVGGDHVRVVVAGEEDLESAHGPSVRNVACVEPEDNVVNDVDLAALPVDNSAWPVDVSGPLFRHQSRHAAARAKRGSERG